jgi:soluble lytic murein transglycosylase-like protein
VDGGTRYLRDMLARYHNDVTLALAAYNAGPEKVTKFGNRVPPYRETQLYVQKIARGYRKIKARGLTANGVGPEAPTAEGIGR